MSKPKRFWASWWSGNYLEDGCTKPPFEHWVSGTRDTRKKDRYDDEQSICAVIDCKDEVALWKLVGKHFSDYEKRFCEEKEAGWVPGDRFPSKKGEK